MTKLQDIPAKFEQGVALHQQGRLADAERIYHEILQQEPTHFGALHLLGVIAVQTRQPERGAELIRRAIDLNPNIAAAHCNLGKALLDLQRPAEALASCDEALALMPDFAEAYDNRGMALVNLRRPEEALASYDQAIALKPDFAMAHHNRGNALAYLKRPEDALASFDQAIALQPNLVEAHNSHAITLAHLQRPEEAVTSFDRVITLKPEFAMAHSNRSNVLLDLRRPAEALASCDRAVALNPNLAVAHHNRGLALQDLKRPEEALTSYDKAIALSPDFAEANWSKSLCLLQLGRFDEGWRVYEWRKRRDELVAARSFPQPLWLGKEDIAGKTLFIWCEQGLGDTLQFCRYATLAEARGAKVIMSVQQSLFDLLKQIGPTIEVINENDVPDKFDYHCPLLSLPLAFGTTLATIPAPRRYMQVSDEQRLAWLARLPAKTKPRIGLVWSGKTEFLRLKDRSIDLEQLLPILSPDADWICLQKEIREQDSVVFRQLGRIAFFGDELRDFSDTAALLDQMDLVITIDTSVAHLAGAMGKPVWILLRYNPDWRWLLDRDDCPWYPSAWLFRQQQIGDWAAVIDQVKDQLRCVIG